jgi:hypothetical protein
MLGAGRDATSTGAEPTPEARALEYLAREVPLWPRENHCYSCHNNGDAARALYGGIRAKLDVPPGALADTTAWLANPGRWDHNGGDGVFSDKRLARLQFTAALASAVASGQVDDRGELVRIARRLAGDQADDGAFLLEGGDSLGSPATYGRPLATLVFRDTLRQVDATRFRAEIDGAERWLVASSVGSLLDAAAVLPVVAGIEDDPGARAQRRRCLDLIARGQSTDGGWGPYVRSPPEAADTAIVILALVRAMAAAPKDTNRDGVDRAALTSAIARGRAYLIATQRPDGSWPETTRPAGGESYAQRLSTTGWATLALLATRGGPT